MAKLIFSLVLFQIEQKTIFLLAALAAAYKYLLSFFACHRIKKNYSRNKPDFIYLILNGLTFYFLVLLNYYTAV